MVAEQNLDTPYTPASTMKTLTAYAAAATLDMGSTLETQTYLEQREDGTSRLVLKGNGDMLLGVGESDSAHINGRAGLGTLAANTAQALRQRGITSVTLVYDDSLFGNDRWPNGIAELDPDHVYYAPTASMAVDGGRNWNGANPTDPDTFSTYPVLSTQPAREAALVFAQRLTERGIAVNGSVEQGAVPDGTSPIATVSSASLNEIMAFMLRHSDNSLAEEFGRLLALHLNAGNSPAGAVQSVEQVLAQRGISAEGLTMINCSGLAEDSKLTAHTLLDVQQRNLTSGSGSAAAEGLSIVGFVGTAANRLNDADEAGLIRAKTGSLGDVTSMTGNVSRHNGGALSFAVIVNDPDDSEAAKSAIDTFVAALPKLGRHGVFVTFAQGNRRTARRVGIGRFGIAGCPFRPSWRARARCGRSADYGVLFRWARFDGVGCGCCENVRFIGIAMRGDYHRPPVAARLCRCCAGNRRSLRCVGS